MQSNKKNFIPKNIIYFRDSTRDIKKYMVFVEGKTVHFGSRGMSDFTKHKDPERKERYILRHKVNENWDKSGIKTAGFWSRHALWGKDTLDDSLKYIESHFDVEIKRGWPAHKK
jgi:hypothetical protein